MPELPEVETTVAGLNKRVCNFIIKDVWTDYKSLFHAGKNNIQNPEYFKDFKRDVLGARIQKASRSGKYVLIHLSNGKTILTHMKMTGHYLYGEYVFRPSASGEKSSAWRPKDPESPLADPYNRHIHLVFTLSSGKHLVFSDARKFAKIFVFDTSNEKVIADLMHLGPDPLSKNCTFRVFKKQLLTQPRGRIKSVLMDQHVVSGIGNIYSDEILWAADVHPLSKVENIPDEKLKKMFKEARALLKRGIKFGGDSDSDYRNVDGLRGKFQNKHKVYRRKDELCLRGDGGKIQRLAVGGRSAHFCPKHQVKY